jgi:fatty-acyl-CoA synthase
VTPGDRNLFAAFERAAEREPAAPALTFLDTRLEAVSYSYGQLFARVDEIAGRLARHRLDPAAPFGILSSSQETQVLHYLAALSLGLTPAILTPPNRKLNPEYFLATTRAVIAYGGFSAVVTDLEDLELGATTLAPDSVELRRRGTVPLSDGAAGAAFLQFSSGTTGIKRGVLVGHEAALAQLDAYGKALGLGAGDCIVSWLPLYHDMGFVACLNLPLAHGAHCVMMNPLDWVANPVMYLEAATRYRATLGWNPNFAYAFMAERVRDADGIDLSSLRGLVNCSEPVTHRSQQLFADRFAAHGAAADVFVGCYAMAETTFALTHAWSTQTEGLDRAGPEDLQSRGAALPLVSVGIPIEGVELAVADSDGNPLSERRIGELVARAPFTFAGYYGNEADTVRAFRDGWYRTGDLGYRVGESFFVCGRHKDLVIVGGVNVHPQDIEEVAGSVDGARPGRVAAFAEHDGRAETERVTVLIESSSAGAERTRLVMDARQAILASLQIANFGVEVVPPGWLIKSSSGKMARSANREKWARETALRRAA